MPAQQLLCVIAALLVAAGRRDDEEAHEGILQAEGPPPASSGSGLALSKASFEFLKPEVPDLEEVRRFASELAGGGQRGRQASTSVAEQPSRAAVLLQRLAGERRAASDNSGDRDQQTYNHLLELHFQARSSALSGLTRGEIWQLAEDSRRLQKLKNMSKVELDAIPEADTDNFVHYFRSHAQKRNAEGVRGISLTEMSAGKHNKKRAVVFSCSFGDGHKSAMASLREILESDGFEVIPVDTTTDARFSTEANTLGTLWYNQIMMRWQWYQVQNMLETAGSFLFGGQLLKPCPAPTCNTPRKDAFRAVLLESNPDIVITVYHMDLLPILEVAKDLGNLPVLHISTDMDLKMREVFGDGPSLVYPRFKLAMSFPEQTSQSTAAPLLPDKTFLSGYPVRKPFLEPKNLELVEREREKLTRPAQPGAKVVLVMTGGGGQDVPWPDELAMTGIGIPLHLVIIVGRNAGVALRLQHSLARVSEPGSERIILRGQDPNTTLEVARTGSSTYITPERLALLMDMADAIITKPGGGTTAEVAYRGLPAVFDATHGLLHWEDFTVRNFEMQNLGERFTYGSELPEVLLRALKREHSSRLVEDPTSPGHVLNPRPRILQEARSLMEIPCKGCLLFPKTPAT